MFNDKYVDEYFKIIKDNPKEYKKDYEKMLSKRKEYKATYLEEPVPALYQGFFYDRSIERVYEKMSEILMSITKKVTDKYVEDPEYRKLFGFDSLIEKLILKDPGYDIPVPIARYDVFYDGNEDYKFCEFNTDGSSAMLEDKALANLFENTKAYKKMSQKYKLTNTDQLIPLVDALLDIYKNAKAKENPNVVIADIIDHENTEFEYFKELFEKKSLNCKIADIRDFVKKDDGVYVDDMKVDLVYRRLVTSDLLEYKNEAKDFIDGYMNSDFIAIGSFRSTLFYTKDIFRILLDKKTLEFLDEEEREFVKKHIPFTQRFDYEKDYEELIANKDKYILKPIYGYASKGIFVGKEMNKEQFKKALDEIKDIEYIYQEYYEVDPMKYVVFDPDAKLKEFSFVTGLFIYNKKFISPYTRIGTDNLISSAREYFTIPAMLIEDK